MDDYCEPEWAKAQREENRRFNNIWKGMFVGNGVAFVILSLVLSLEREFYMKFAGYFFAVVSIGALWLAKRGDRGSLKRSAAITIGVFFAFAAIIFLFGGDEA